MEKTARENTKYSRNETILKMGHLAKALAMVYSLCKMVSLGAKLITLETCEKQFYNNIRVVLCKKTARKNTKYSRNEKVLQIGHLAKAIVLENGKFGSKIKSGKNMQKTILQYH